MGPLPKFRSILQGQSFHKCCLPIRISKANSLLFLLLQSKTSHKSVIMSRFGVFALIAMLFVAQALAADDETAKVEEEPDNPYGRSSHFNMEMYRLATVGGFIVVALVLGVVVYKTCSWPRLE